MRAMAILVAVALLAGCATLFGMPRCQNPQPAGADCSYGLTAVIASAWFLDDEWDTTRAAEGLRAAGFEVEHTLAHRVASARTFEPGNVSAAADRAANGSFTFGIEWTVSTGLGLTRDEANARAAEAEAENQARAEALLRAFEDATGWRRDADMAWMRGIVVT